MRLEAQERLGLLEDDSAEAIDAAVAVIEPICTRQVAYEPTEVLGTVEALIIRMVEEDQQK